MSWKASMLLAALMMSAGSAWAEQGVPYYKHPPSVDELERAFLAPEAPSPRINRESSTGTPPNEASPDEGGAPVGRELHTRQIYRCPSVEDDEGQPDRMAARDSTVARDSPAAPVAKSPADADKDAAAPLPVPGRVVALPVQFEFGRATIVPRSQAFISVVAQLMQRIPALKLMIEGHTDSVGPRQVNTALSWERASSVLRALVDQYGVDPARLQTVGKGSADPLPDMWSGCPQNRRVQFRAMS